MFTVSNAMFVKYVGKKSTTTTTTSTTNGRRGI